MASNLDLRRALREISRESLPAPTFPPVDPALVTRTLRAAARSRRRRSWLAVNCGGPGSGRPGPCPSLLHDDKYDLPAEGGFVQGRKGELVEYESNPSKFKLAKMLNQSQGGVLRGLVDGQRIVVWDAYKALHKEVSDQLQGRGVKAVILSKSVANPSQVLITGHDIGLDDRSPSTKGKEWIKDHPYFKRLNTQLDATETGTGTLNTAANVGRGQFSSQRAPWRVTIRRLAPYLLDLMPDLTKGQAEGIARSIQLGLRSDAPDSEVADMIEGYGIEPERAALIARTEMARARADTELGNLKPNERVVYVLAPDACPKCVKMKRKYKERRLTAKQAQGIIPVHPNCYCRWKTVNVKSGREVTRNEVGADSLILEYSRLVENEENCGIGKGGFQPGNTCAKGDGDVSVANETERKASLKLARRKIREAPIPSAEQVEKARRELQLARDGKIRAGGFAGGNSEDRKRQARNLFREFGGEDRGYVPCPWTGIKLHWTTDPKENPKGYAKLERGKIFTKCQGGGYQLPNLIPESFAANRSRNDKRVRKENDDGC